MHDTSTSHHHCCLSHWIDIAIEIPSVHYIIPFPKGENGRKNSLTIFARISFYSVGNGNGKVRNRIRSVKSGPSKTDKSEQKCLDIDR
jgi:hypothetical protein